MAIDKGANTVMANKVKVIIVDDSALIRALLSKILSDNETIEVVATAGDPYEARELIKKYNPDVLTLDIEMPKMNGLAFLKNLMRLRPMPVVMISTLTHQGASATLEALALGAIDFISKPKNEGNQGITRYKEQITQKILMAAMANINTGIEKVSNQKKRNTDQVMGNKSLRKHFICAIGASTGGTEAIKNIISALPVMSPPIVITQHIPEFFSGSFARRVDSISHVNVFEAQNNQVIEAGNVYIAPGHSHLTVAKVREAYVCRLDKSDAVNRHRPSVEVLFDSIAHVAAPNALAVLLTGMGADGAQAMLRMREAYCDTVAQDEATSTVWGMPRVAVNIGAAKKILPLNQIARYILTSAFRG